MDKVGARTADNQGSEPAFHGKTLSQFGGPRHGNYVSKTCLLLNLTAANTAGDADFSPNEP